MRQRRADAKAARTEPAGKSGRPPRRVDPGTFSGGPLPKNPLPGADALPGAETAGETQGAMDGNATGDVNDALADSK
jgi:hypothetical protein